MEIITLNVEYFFEEKYWIARCNEVGLVGYQHRNLADLKHLVSEGIELHVQGRPYKLIEVVIPSENRSAV